MALPHDLYIRYLVTKGCDSQGAVNSELAKLGLPRIEMEDFMRHYNAVDAALPPAIMKQASTKKYEMKFFKWMEVIGLKEIWIAEGPWAKKEMVGAWKLLIGCLADPKLVLTLNSMLVKVNNDQEISEIINGRFSAMLMPAHVALYRKYFFDCTKMTRADWKGYLANCTAVEKHLYFTALTESLDVLKTELELPANVSVASSLQYLLMKAFQKSKHYLKSSTPESNREARAWISQTISLADKYEKYKTGDKEDFSKQLLMEFDYVNEDIPAPDDDMLAQIMADQGQAKLDN